MTAMVFRTAVALLPVLILTACQSKKSTDTGVVVEVGSDLGVSEMNAVKVVGTDARNQELSSYTFDLTGSQSFPLHAEIDRRGDSSAPIQIKAVGLLNGVQVVSRSATLSFDPGRKVLLGLPLLAVCKPVVCGEAYTTCKESGTCEPDGVMSKDLPTYVAYQTASGQDAATPRPDAEVVDAPAEAGSPDGGLSPSDGRTSSSDVSSSGGATAGSTASSDSTSSTGGSRGGNTPLGGTTSSGGHTPAGGAGTTASGGTGGITTNGGTRPVAGTTSSGGVGGRSSSVGGSVSIERPAGYWKMSDWGVNTVDWHGCTWTAIDSSISGSDTTLSPADFASGTPNGGPYNISGSVYNDYGAVAILGFNLNEDPTGAANQCAHNPVALASDGPPAVTMPPSGATGFAINWNATQLPPNFRIQIQGVQGSTDASHRWCATIKDATGPSFVPFSEFNTECWSGKGNAYKNEPIDAVTFQVPGTSTAKSPYNITLIRFVPGTSKADAAVQPAVCGSQTGTIGASTLLTDATQAKDASYQRRAVIGKDCKKYIINNNNVGQPTSTYQQLSYFGSSFKIDAANGLTAGQGVPASYPSIFVGANGNVANGSFETWSDTGLPKAINAITTAKTTFKWSGKASGDFNATYDAWFAKTAPLPGSYADGISGFVRVWLYRPDNRFPTSNAENYQRSAHIGGTDWDVWVGPRGTTASGTDDQGRPVISYVAKSTITAFSGDLRPFFDDAVLNAASDKTHAGTSQAFSADWLLTDVFAGFELWTGSDGVGLKADEFTFQLN